MNGRKKAFDCVEMKNEIQRKLLDKWKGLSQEEIVEQLHRDLATSDDPVARWWRRVREHQAAKGHLEAHDG